SLTLEMQPPKLGFVGKLTVERTAFLPYWPQKTLIIDLADRAELWRTWSDGGRARAEAARREAAAEQQMYGLMTQAAVPAAMRTNLRRLLQARERPCDDRVLDLTYEMGQRLGPMARGIFARRMARECGLTDMATVENSIDTLLATNWLRCLDLSVPLGPSSLLVAWGCPFPGEPDPSPFAKRPPRLRSRARGNSMPWLGCGRRK
ncbi:hypothetical protein FBZ90_1131, partial [Nitrospirillum pindoramense]